MHIDLNADLGESFGSWVKGNDEALLDIISSANIACGFHAGDPDVMAKTIKLAKSSIFYNHIQVFFSDLLRISQIL